jgi:APA family basic amino acid/polyamine antiporter
MILGTGELAYSMALRGDIPAIFARTRAGNTPVLAQWLGAALASLLILANATRATASLFTFVILLSTAAILVLYLVGCLAAWKHSRPAERPIIVLAIGFSLFALWGAGAEANAWGVVLLAVGYALRFFLRRLSSTSGSTLPQEAIPAAPVE